jgi:hypothetical protein
MTHIQFRHDFNFNATGFNVSRFKTSGKVLKNLPKTIDDLPYLAQPLTSSKMFTFTQSYLTSFNLKNFQAKLFLSSCGLYFSRLQV